MDIGIQIGAAEADTLIAILSPLKGWVMEVYGGDGSYVDLVFEQIGFSDDNELLLTFHEWDDVEGEPLPDVRTVPADKITSLYIH